MVMTVQRVSSDNPQDNRENGMERYTLFSRSIFLLIFGYLLLGVAHIALLPPWEGFDETAHYSYLQQITDTHKIPRQGASFISKDVETYRLFAPIPYSSVPPVEHNGGFTYRAFFESSDEVVKRGGEHIHKPPMKPRKYTEGNGLNWQSQHPPLYYLLLSPIYLSTKHLSWGVQLFILRLTSYLFAWSALYIGCMIYLRRIHSNNSKTNEKIYYWITFGFGIWPILLPSWFPEMARMGNDSLCALIMALIWAVSIRACSKGLSPAYAFVIGLLLGMGCLTKSFFVPVTVGIVGFWMMRQWVLEGPQYLRSKSFLLCLPLMLLTTVLISGWWYFMNWYQHDVALGSDEMIQLKNAGGLLNNLIRNFSLKAWLRGHAAFITTFAWPGTWSLARPQYIYLAPMAFIGIFVSTAYLNALRNFKIAATPWLSAWVSLPVLLGFSYHVLLRIALTGEGRGTSGYYLHFLVVPLIVALGIGLAKSWHNKGFRITIFLLLCYSTVFSVLISWAQFLLFSGILFIHGNSKFYQTSVGIPYLVELSDAFNRLKIIAFPKLGISACLLGTTLIAIGVAFLWKSGIGRHE